MVMAFEVVPGREGEIAAALHAGDRTTRPQTVRREVNPLLLGAHRRLPPSHRRARRAQHLVQRKGRADRVQLPPTRSAASTGPAWTRSRSAASSWRSRARPRSSEWAENAVPGVRRHGLQPSAASSDGLRHAHVPVVRSDAQLDVAPQTEDGSVRERRSARLSHLGRRASRRAVVRHPVISCARTFLPGARVLDVGCGFGSFLIRAREAGYAVAGIEPDAHACAGACKVLGAGRRETRNAAAGRAGARLGGCGRHARRARARPRRPSMRRLPG